MEDNKMTNEMYEENNEVEMEETDMIEYGKSGSGLGKLIIGGLIGAGSVLAYKFIAKPLIEKRKAKKDPVEVEGDFNASNTHDVEFKVVKNKDEQLTNENK